MKTLYLCYFGLREPLVQRQVVPYLRHIARDGIRVFLLTFEPQPRRRWSIGEVEVWRTRLATDGIQWFMLPYHKWPSALATLYDIVVGAWTAWWLVRRFHIEILHARSHVPMVMALLVRRLFPCRIVFDVRGFLADEYAAARRWSERSLIFQGTKWLEKMGLRQADQVVVLTERARRWLLDQGFVRADRINVIPCCVDTARFASGADSLDAWSADGFEVIYTGSVTGLYLVEEMGRFFLALRAQQPNAFLRIFTQGPIDYARRVLRRVGVPPESFWVGHVPPEQIASHIKRARLGLSFRKTTFAKIGACPTKIPEYLAAGVPVVATPGVGDMDELLEQAKVGILIQRLDQEGYEQAAREALWLSHEPGVQDRCQRIALTHFDLDRVGGPAYHRVYRRLMRKAQVLFLTPYPRDCAPSQRLKFEQYYAYFEQRDIEVTISSFVSPMLWRILYEPGHWMAKGFWTVVGYLRRTWDVLRAGWFDAVYLHLWAVPFGPPWFEERLARRGIPIIYDIDDLIYLPKASRANAFLSRFRKKEICIGRIMRVARHVIVCTEYLRQFGLRYNPQVTNISATIDTDLYVPRRHSQARDDVTIGWSGSHSTSQYLHQLVPVLRELSQRFDLRLLVVGDVRFRMEGVRVEARPWNLARETTDLAEMDIGVYPLPEEEWVLGKSGLKALQYMGMGIPVVASAIGEACNFIRDGENGFLARTLEEWLDRLSRLILNPELRASLGSAGRATVEERFSVQVMAPVYHQVLKSVLMTSPSMEGTSGEGAASWTADRLGAAGALAKQE